MNIIFRFGDLEISDLSKLNSVEASPEAKVVIRQAQQTAAQWQARFTINAINQEDISYSEKVQLVRDIREELASQL